MSTAQRPGRRPDEISESTRMAMTESLISPRFYTTDADAINRISVDNIRPQWNALMAEFEGDNNIDHFQRPADMDRDYSKLDPELYKEFTDFYIPEELPPGKVTIELTGKTSVKNIQPISFKKTIDLK